MLVSIIIPARTKEEIFFPVQNYKDVEMIPAVGGTLVEARKKAIMQAKGRYILLLDSDQRIAHDAIEKCVSICESGYDGVTLTEESYLPLTFLEEIISYDKDLFHSAGDDDPLKGAAEPRFFRASFLKNLNFNLLPPLTFELTFINKQVREMGAKIYFSHDAFLYHQEPRTFKILYDKFWRYGYYYIPALEIDRETVRAHSRPRRIYFTKKALRNPLLYCGLWLHYFVKGVATFMGIMAYKKHRFILTCCWTPNE
jgi:glycosyltransferase involved in cell wall biosynthesis